MFKPYDPKIRGPLEDYLRIHDGFTTHNLFRGPKYFIIIRNNGWLQPLVSWVRVNQSPIPDITYWITEHLELQSNGPGEYNMSCMGAKKGIYTPDVLKKRDWSIFHLKLPETT